MSSERAEKRRKRFKRFKKGPAERGRDKKSYDDIVKENKDFESYYKLQDIIADDEWTSFMSCLREPLPSAFRLTSYCKSQTIALRDIIESNEFNEDREDPKSGLRCIDWYPNRFAWNINVSRVEIRKSESFRSLQNFLISETDSGYISRQEAVSMIPALLLDVKPGQRVLDMCAAPGSKTAQIIELLHREDGTPEGVVVANDVDNKRCYMLVHQSKRLHSSSTIITNHDAGAMPDFYDQLDGQRVVLKFDRILCDVPCSGDGTIRKNYDVWTKWNVANGNNFHGIQLRIARRGLEMLDKNGILVYSTCSLNPIEDEAVIASLLNLAEGGAHLEDVSTVLPNLKYCKGLEDWNVVTREMTVVKSAEDVEEKYRSQIRDSLFPPKNARQLNLNRCLRVLPHLQNTGGFFVAVIRKTVDWLPWQTSEGKTANETSDQTTDETPNQNESEDKKELPVRDQRPTRRKRRTYGYKEDPFIFLDETDVECKQIKDYYGIADSFPFGQLVHRCLVGKKRNIYFLTEAAKRIVINNEKNIKVINGGVRLMARSDDKVNPCHFRLTQEGLPTLFPYLSSGKVVEIKTTDAKRLLSSENVALDEFDETDGKRLSELNSGCCVLVIRRDGQENSGLPLTLPICAWKGKNSLRAYIAKNERIHFLRLCGADVSETDAKRSTEREKHKEKNKSNDVEVETQDLNEIRVTAEDISS